MPHKHFIWPQPSFYSSLANSTRSRTPKHVEDRLIHMFNGGFPVLYSSARAALASALSELNLTRIDNVGVFPYASHCVLDTISRIATPKSLSQFNSFNVVYHQWGYTYKNPLISPTIEDSVDTLMPYGGHLFSQGGAFELWSFPKIAATSGGGVLWCRSYETADRLRTIRDNQPHQNLLWLMRLLGLKSHLLYTMWQGAEAFFGRPSPFLSSEIDYALDNWSTLISDRQLKLDLAWQYAPSWLSKPVDKLPCVLPVEVKVPFDHRHFDEILPITISPRHFVRVLPSGSHHFTSTIPVPIHQDLKVSELTMILEAISSSI